MAAGGHSTTSISQKLRMTRTTMYACMKRQPAVAEAIARGRAKLEHALVHTLARKALDGDSIAAMFLLKARFNYRDQVGCQDGCQRERDGRGWAGLDRDLQALAQLQAGSGGAKDDGVAARGVGILETPLEAAAVTGYQGEGVTHAFWGNQLGRHLQVQV